MMAVTTRTMQQNNRFSEENNRPAHIFKFQYLFSPSSAKQQHEMPKFKVLWRA